MEMKEEEIRVERGSGGGGLGKKDDAGGGGGCSQNVK